MSKLRMALVGAGVIGGVHAVALHENPSIDFAAVVDIKREAAVHLAGQYGIPAYDSLEECLKQEAIDAVDLCVNEENHVAPAVLAARAGKHILLEKPIARTTAEALTIKAAAEENGVRLMIAHLLHFDARYAVLLDAVQAGKLGEISGIYVKRCNTLATCRRIGGKVSFMYYLAVHDIELMCAYAGGKARRVYAQFPNKICRAYGDDDGIYAIITFDNGVVGCLEIDWSYQESMPMPVWSYAKVSGTRGTGVVEAGPQGLTLCTDDQFAYPDTMLAPTFNGQMQGDMVLQIDHFAQCILHDRPFAVQLDTPIDAVRIIEACFASGQTGQAVEIGS